MKTYNLDEMIARNIGHGLAIVEEGKQSFESMTAEQQASCLANMAKMREFEQRAASFAQTLGFDITLVTHGQGRSGHGYYFGHNVYSRYANFTEDLVRFVCRMVGILSPDRSAVNKVINWIKNGE